MMWRLGALPFHLLQFVFELVNSLPEFAFAAFSIRYLLGFDLGLKRVCGELGSLTQQLALEGTKAAIQLPPARVDHRTIGPRNLLRLVFA